MVSFQIAALRWGRVSQDGTYETAEKIASAKGVCLDDRAGSHGFLQNDAGTNGTRWHKSDTASSANVHDLDMENPGALAGATGVKEGQKVNSTDEYTRQTARARFVDWNRQRWGWLKAVTADASLVPMARLLATVLVTQFSHHQTAHCAPGTDTLAAALGTSVDTIKRAFRALSEAGWLTKTDGRGRGNRSVIVFHGAENIVPIIRPEAGSGPENAAGKGGMAAPFSVPQGDARKGAGVREKGGTDAPSHIKADPKSIQRVQARPEALDPERRLVKIDRHSFHEEAWNDWLRKHGFASLQALGQRCDDGWAVPFRHPPQPDGEVSNRIAEKWARWGCSASQGANHAE